MSYEQTRMPGRGEPGIYADLKVSSVAWQAALNSIGRGSIGQVSTGQVSIGQVSIGQVSTNQSPNEEVSLELGINEIRLAYGGVTVAVPANGEGYGCAVFSSTYIRPLLTVARLLGASAVRLFVDSDGSLFIGTTRVACLWQEAPQATIRLTPSGSLPEILRLRYSHSLEEIASAGLADGLFDAECRKADLVARAAEILLPLGVSLPALDHFVNDLIRHKNQEQRRAS